MEKNLGGTGERGWKLQQGEGGGAHTGKESKEIEDKSETWGGEGSYQEGCDSGLGYIL